MYWEQYKQGQAEYLISMNESMKNILDEYGVDYKSLRQATTLPLRLSEYIEGGIGKLKDTDCYTWKNIKGFELFYQDCTGNEYSNNKVHIDAECNTAETLATTLEFAFAIAELLDSIPESFNVVASYDGTDFTVSFYCKRDTEEWLAGDLDSYAEEAIFVITT